MNQGTESTGTQWTVYRDPTSDESRRQGEEAPDDFIHPESFNWRKGLLLVALVAIGTYGVFRWGVDFYYEVWPGAEPPTPYFPPVVERAELDRIMNAAAEISGFDPVDDYRVEFVSRPAIADIANELPEDPEDRAEREESIRDFEALTKLLGLIPQDSDLEELIESSSSAVLGLYDRDSGTIYVATDGPEFTLTAEVTLVHEFVHLFQAVHYDLDLFDEQVQSDSEAEAAFHALIEGHAEFVEKTYLFDVLTESQRDAWRTEYEEIDTSGLPELPEILWRVSLWPYSAGEEFIWALDFRGFEIPRIYFSLPETTEQVLDVRKYTSNELAFDGPVPEGLLRTQDDEWMVIDQDVMGAAFISLWLDSIVTRRDTSDQDEHEQLVADWARDDYLILENESGERALASIIQWDSTTDVREFQTEIGNRLRESGGYERLPPEDSEFDLWSGPQGLIGFVDIRDGPEATFMAVGPSVPTVERLLRTMTGGPVSSVDAGRSLREEVPPLPTSVPSPTPAPTPNPGLEDEPQVEVDLADVNAIADRLKLLGLLPQEGVIDDSVLSYRPRVALDQLVKIPDVGTLFGEDWTVREEAVGGAHMIRKWLQELGSDEGHEGSGVLAAEKWINDGYALIDGPGSQTALMWRIAWDDSNGKTRFATIVERTLDASPHFRRLESSDAEQFIWQGPAGVLGFQASRSYEMSNVVVSPGQDLTSAVLRGLRFTARFVPVQTSSTVLPTPGPVPTRRPLVLPTPTTVPELLPVDDSARVADIVARLKLLGMISQDESDREARLAAEENRPLLPHTSPMSFPWDLITRLGDGWTIREEGEAGINFIENWLWSLGSDAGAHDGSYRDAANGWVTDAYRLLDGPGGQMGLVWRIDWRNPDWDKSMDILSTTRLADLEAAEFSEVLHRTLDQSPDFQRIESEISEQSLWRGPGGVLGFRNDNPLSWTSIVVFEDVDSVLTALYELSFI